MEFINHFKKYTTKCIEEVNAKTLNDKELKDHKRRKIEIHPSSFPLCGLRMWYEQQVRPLPDDMEQVVIDEEFGGDYYCNVGTLFHSIIQKWLGRGKKIVGNWKCHHVVNGIKCTGKRGFSTNPECPKCGTEMRYYELGVHFGKYTVGHTDGVFLFKGKYYVIDYKTSSTEKIVEHERTKKVFPYLSNLAQIKSYCFYLEQQYPGLEISGYMLIYISRDSPTKYRSVVGSLISKAEKAKIGKTCETIDRHFDIVLNAKTLKDILPLVREKPCKNKEEYMKTMYNYFAQCPLASVCFRPEKLKSTLTKAYSGELREE